MTIYHSAPSTLVHDDLHRVFKNIWPALKLKAAPSPRQQRDSDDCEIFIVLNIMVEYLRVNINDPFTLPARLRPLLFKISKSKIHKADALNKYKIYLTK